MLCCVVLHWTVLHRIGLYYHLYWCITLTCLLCMFLFYLQYLIWHHIDSFLPLNWLTKNCLLNLNSTIINTVWCGSILTCPPPHIKRLNSTRKQSDVSSSTSTYSFKKSLMCPFLFPCLTSLFFQRLLHSFFSLLLHYFLALLPILHACHSLFVLTLNHAGGTRSWLQLLMTATSTCSTLLSIGEFSQMCYLIRYKYTSKYIYVHAHIHAYIYSPLHFTHSSLLLSNIFWYPLFSITLRVFYSISPSIFFPQWFDEESNDSATEGPQRTWCNRGHGCAVYRLPPSPALDTHIRSRRGYQSLPRCLV